MVKKKEENVIPTATVALDDDKGLTIIEEGKERESQVVSDKETINTEEKKDHKSEDEQIVIPAEESVTINQMEIINVSEQTSHANDVTETEIETVSKEAYQNETETKNAVKSNEMGDTIDLGRSSQSEMSKTTEPNIKENGVLEEPVDQTIESSEKETNAEHKQISINENEILKKTQLETSENEPAVKDTENAVETESEKIADEENAMLSSGKIDDNADVNDSQMTT